MSVSPSAARPWLALYAKLVVCAVLALIFLGGLVTSWQAGMAVPDWPLSFGSINPDGWWGNFGVRLEHGHRLVASMVGLLTMLLCSWVWRNKWLMGTAGLFAVGLVHSFVQRTQHQQRTPAEIMHIGLWVAAIMFVVLALYSLVLFTISPKAEPGERTLRWLAFSAFVGVCLQATLGGLRVTGQTGGALHLALALRVFHACVAQAYLCSVVALAILLTIDGAPSIASTPRLRSLGRFGWVTVGSIYLQLILGAVMRHLSPVLAISTFPAASPSGSWLPAEHSAAIDANFTHTRIGASIVTFHVVWLAIRVLRTAPGKRRLVWPAIGLLALVAAQVTMGVFVVLHGKPPTLTTFHVLNGAALLALAVLLTLRLRGLAPAAELSPEPLSSTHSTPVPA